MRIVLGRIAGAFGVRGFVKIASYTDPPEQILAFQPWRMGDEDEVRHVEGKRHGNAVVARLEGVGDRDAAAALAGHELWVEREALPALGEREHYRADLIGLEVVNLEGVPLGRIESFLDMPANPVMVVVGERERWLPVGKGQLLRVDREQGRVTVDWDAEF
jgi:16S rRNA processing protein RimM